MKDIFTLILMVLILVMGVQLSIMLGSIYPVLITLHINFIIYVLGEFINSISD